jgi:ATP-dependent DNA helicase RecG
MNTEPVTRVQVEHLTSRQEGHFLDYKSKQIKPSKLTKTLSAFANADGGELLIGVEEPSEGVYVWDGFARTEDANGHVQHLEEFFPYGNDFIYEFLEDSDGKGIVLRISVLKTRDIRPASDNIVYIRRGAQSLPVIDDAKIRELQLAKGFISHEDQTLRISVDEVSNSIAVLGFVMEIIPEVEPVAWLKKQRLIEDDLPTVAGVLLFADEPQVAIPKANVKIYRYGSADEEGSRETLAFDPATIEGCLYLQIQHAVSETVRITEQVQKLTEHGLVNIEYPRETLHEVITNALLHRDYSFNDDVHVRIFDNRIEIESPGRLPAHITPKNILSERFARNPTTVRIINKFPDPPNKDVGEGLNTAFAAMARLRLRPPEIIERDNSVLVVIRHESLASPEQQIVEYLHTNPTINNGKAREITGVRTDHEIRRCFRRLVTAGEIEQVPGTGRRTTRYRLPE